jgi:two-component system phosphate regulon response regulator PhoB
MSEYVQELRLSAPPGAARRILILERDPASGYALRSGLSEAGFAVTVLEGDDDALAAIDRERPHLVLLDWEHPAALLHSLIRHIQREQPWRARLVALSPFAGEDEIVSGFELGVDDYVVRPFSLPVLTARVRALLRVLDPAPEEHDVLEFQRLRLDLVQRRFTVGTRVVPLRPKEHRFLEFLMRHPERVFTRKQLLHSVPWPGGARFDPRAVDVTVQRARSCLAAHGCAGYLQTVRGAGYRLSARA